MAETIQVRGLRECLANMKKLGEGIKSEITKDALRKSAWVIAGAVRAKTYSTFTQRTGAIRKGFGVRVQKTEQNDQLTATVVQYETAVAARATKMKGGKTEMRPGIAFWWRFLEFGTRGRKQARTIRTKPGRRISERTKKALARYNAAKSLGDLPARPWVGPAFQASAPYAITRFQLEIRNSIETTVNTMPK